jgi:hypothetical protein
MFLFQLHYSSSPLSTSFGIYINCSHFVRYEKIKRLINQILEKRDQMLKDISNGYKKLNIHQYH